MKRIVTILTLFAVSFGVYNCSNSLPSITNSETKTMTVAFAIRTNSEFTNIAHYAYVKVTGPDMDSIVEPMVLTNEYLSASVPNIPLGFSRKFSIAVYDSMGTVRYFGSQIVSLDGAPTRVTIMLKKMSGPVEVIGIIQDGPDTTWDTTHTDTNYYPDTNYYDTTWHKDTTNNKDTVGGPCAYDSVKGNVVFRTISQVPGDTVYLAKFDFYAGKTKMVSDRQIVTLPSVAHSIVIGSNYKAQYFHIILGTCAPEMFDIVSLGGLYWQ